MTKPSSGFRLKSVVQVALLALATTAMANEIVRPAPNFTLPYGKSLRSLLGQPVVLVIAPSPESKAFRKEIRSLEKSYEAFAARGTVFVAAFTESSAGAIHTNIPFATANDGAGIAANYGATAPITVAVIGEDGNMDLKSYEIAPAYKVREAILNNFQLQAAERPANTGAGR